MTEEECIDKGGQVRTEQVGDNQYRLVCTLNGETVYGRTRDKQTTKQKRRALLTKKVKDENKRGSLKGS